MYWLDGDKHSDFDPSSAVAELIPGGGLDAFVAKDDAVGNIVWAKNIRRYQLRWYL